MLDVRLVGVRGDARIELTFASGGATVLFGRSGTGKSTALAMIAGLLRPRAGHVRLHGDTLFDAAAGIDRPVERRRIGFVFQEPRLFPHLRVAANLRYGARGDAAIGDTARMLDIAHLLDRRPATLSGGEARRVAIGRALLSDPRLLLLDEPTASLDGERREEVLRAVERVRDGTGLPIVMVTHDRAEAERIGRVVAMG